MAPETSASSDNGDTLPTGRVEAFSDGVLAVAITLLVLEVKLPERLESDREIWRAMQHIAPTLLTWVVSFTFILTFWVSHHYFFSGLRHADRVLLWLNGVFLLCVTLIPFPTGLVGQYPGLSVPLALQCGAMFLTSLSFAGMRMYASGRRRLLHPHITQRHVRNALIYTFSAPILYAVAFGLSFVWIPSAIAVQILVLLLFILKRPPRSREGSAI